MAGYPKSLRLRSKVDFQTMYDKSFRVFGDFFILRLRPGEPRPAPCPRLGAAAPRPRLGAVPGDNVQRCIKDAQEAAAPRPRLGAAAPRPRLGVTVSKKFGNAPYRNRIRRIIKELFRLNLPALAVDAHLSQSKPIIKMFRAKKELGRFFALLSDRPFLKAHAFRGDTLSLKSYAPSSPMGLAARTAFEAVLLYKKLASPNLRPACRFTPTCSEYALDALRIHGFAKGLALAAARIAKCQPLGPSGYDPVPKKKAPPRA